MSDTSSTLPSLISGKHTRPSLFASSSKQFVGFSAKSFSDSEAPRSTISILETKPFSDLCHHLFAERNYRKPHWSNQDSKAVGLGIIDALTNDNSDKQSLNSICTTVVFGSQLKLHIPQIESSSTSPAGSIDSPHSPIEFGIKNKDSKLALHSPAGLSTEASPRTPGIFTGCLSHKEMELSEDYTCVISHGPNPKKTHIFDNCIMENCGDCFVPSMKDSRLLSDQSSDCSSVDFLSSCHTCKKTLAQEVR